MRDEDVVIPGPSGQLQAVATGFGQIASNYDEVIGVNCHPHPLFGGTMNNKVVHTLMRALRELSIPSLRFNFRGVGESQGSYDEGKGEVDDCIAVIDWLQSRFPQSRLLLTGFSFGSYVAYASAMSESLDVRRLSHLILVAPPVHHFPFSSQLPSLCPTTVIQGDIDEVVPVNEVLQWVKTVQPAPDFRLMAQSGHFFHGQLTLLKEQVQSAVKK